jgi:hypothetical protein
MTLRIESQYKRAIPLNIEKLAKNLLEKVPPEHLIGLDVISFVDTIPHKKNKLAGGLYWQKVGRDPALIEIGIEEIYRGMPRLCFFLPFIPKFMLANVLFHEIGHHFQRLAHGVSKREREAFADRYAKQMLKKVFRKWLFFLLPFAPLIHWLNRNAQRKCMPGDL